MTIIFFEWTVLDLDKVMTGIYLYVYSVSLALLQIHVLIFTKW